MTASIAVVGLGRLGLPLALTFARAGFQVEGVERDIERFHLLQQKKSPIPEPGVQELLENAHNFQVLPQAAMATSPIIFIAANTPPAQDGSLDLRDIMQALHETVSLRRIVVISSTLPIGGSKQLSGGFVYNPQFIALGTALRNLREPDFCLIGSNTTFSREVDAIWRQVIRPVTPIFHTSLADAEIAKLALNLYLTMKISFSSLMVQMCLAFGGNVDKVMEVLLSDNRVDSNYLQPGLGLGGSCFPKDIECLIHTIDRQQVPARFVQGIADINREMRYTILEQVLSYQCEPVAVLGLSYKPGVPYFEESKGVRLVFDLHSGFKEKRIVRCWDPAAKVELPPGLFSPSLEACLTGARLAVIATPWPEFENAPWHLMAEPNVLDCWGMLKNREKIHYIRLGNTSKKVWI